MQGEDPYCYRCRADHECVCDPAKFARFANAATMLREYERAFAYLEARVFERKWDGTIGRLPRWFMAGPFRHEIVKWQGRTLLEAIRNVTCPSCGAPDNGTCAYPSESKPGCWQQL